MWNLSNVDLMKTGTILCCLLLLLVGSLFTAHAKAGDNSNLQGQISSSGQVVPVTPTGCVVFIFNFIKTSILSLCHQHSIIHTFLTSSRSFHFHKISHFCFCFPISRALSRQLLVSLANGHLVALDEDTGDLQWTFDTGSPLLTSANPAAAAAATAQPDRDGAHLPSVKEGIFPGTDGSLYIYRPQKFGPPRIEKLPIGVKDLVDISPAPTPDGSLVLGSQRSTVFVLDASRGSLLRTLRGSDSDADADLLSDPAVLGDPGAVPPGGGTTGTTLGPILAIGRKDYVIRSVHPAFGEQWNVSWSSLQHLSSLAVRRPSTSSGSGGGGSTATPGSGKIPAGGDALPAADDDVAILDLVVGPDHSLRRIDKINGWVLWGRKFEAPPLAAYPSSGPPMDLVNAFEAPPSAGGKEENGPAEGEGGAAVTNIGGEKITSGSLSETKALAQLPNQGSCLPASAGGSGKNDGGSAATGLSDGNKQPSEALVVGVMRGGLFGMKVPSWTIPGSNMEDTIAGGTCTSDSTTSNDSSNNNEGLLCDINSTDGGGKCTSPIDDSDSTIARHNESGDIDTMEDSDEYDSQDGISGLKKDGVIDKEEESGKKNVDPNKAGGVGDSSSGGASSLDRDNLVDTEDLDNDGEEDEYADLVRDLRDEDYDIEYDGEYADELDHDNDEDNESLRNWPGSGSWYTRHTTTRGPNGEIISNGDVASSTGLTLPYHVFPWWRESVCQSDQADGSTCAVPLGLFPVEEQCTDSTLVYLPEKSNVEGGDKNGSSAMEESTGSGKKEGMGDNNTTSSWIVWLVIEHPTASIVIFITSGVGVGVAASILRAKIKTRFTSASKRRNGRVDVFMEAIPRTAAAAAASGIGHQVKKPSGKKSRKKTPTAAGSQLYEEIKKPNTNTDERNDGGANFLTTEESVGSNNNMSRNTSGLNSASNNNSNSNSSSLPNDNNNNNNNNQAPPQPSSGPKGRPQQQFSAVIDGVTHVGRLRVGPGILGYGSGGTIVYEGELDGRQVAVKRLLRQFVELAKKEIGALIVSDEHSNIVRCFAMEEDQEFVYLALERCACTLADAMSTPAGRKKFIGKDGLPTEFAMQISEDVGRGLAALHARGIVHRDLKPHNVLLSESGRAKLSDMGLSKKLVPEQASFETVGAGGSPGWQAPEQLALRAGKLGARQTAGVDVFAFGLLIHYCLTGGLHPYGEGVERDAAILRGRRNLSALKNLPEVEDLLSAMLAPTPEMRPSVDAAMAHPLWWPVSRRLAFLIHVSDRVEGEDRSGDGTMYASLEALSEGVVVQGGNWGSVLDPRLISNLGKIEVL